MRHLHSKEDIRVMIEIRYRNQEKISPNKCQSIFIEFFISFFLSSSLFFLSQDVSLSGSAIATSLTHDHIHGVCPSLNITPGIHLYKSCLSVCMSLYLYDCLSVCVSLCLPAASLTHDHIYYQLHSASLSYSTEKIFGLKKIRHKNKKIRY